MSVSTYKRCSRWWRARGYAAIVRPGWTPALRAMALVSPQDHNERQVLVLCLPRKKPAAPRREPAPALTGPLPSSRREPGKAPHAREANPEEKPEKARATRGQPVLPRPGPAPLGAVPQSGSEALAAARAMQERARLLQRISAEHLRHLARPFWLAGWRPSDVLHAIDHEPGGRQHGYTADVRSPAAWIRSRLAAWLSPDGTPLPSPGQQRAAAAARGPRRRRRPARGSRPARGRAHSRHPRLGRPRPRHARRPRRHRRPRPHQVAGTHRRRPPGTPAVTRPTAGLSPRARRSVTPRGAPRCMSRKNARPAASSGAADRAGGPGPVQAVDIGAGPDGVPLPSLGQQRAAAAARAGFRRPR